MPKPALQSWKLMLLALVLVLTACAPLSAPPSTQPGIPGLPSEARASLVPMPSMCSLSCSRGVMTLRDDLANTLTGSGVPALPASGSLTDYSLSPKK